MSSEKDTKDHITKVMGLLEMICKSLLTRSLHHDSSKLGPPEKRLFDELSPKISKVPYGSPEYKEMLEQLKPSLDHHYQNNRHHPEFHHNGINDMTLVDLSEMLCDWYASSLRSAKGDINQSLEINKERFGISDQLHQILCNTIEALKKGKL